MSTEPKLSTERPRPGRRKGNRKSPLWPMRQCIAAKREPESGLRSCACSFSTLPLSGDPEQKTQLSVAGRRCLDVELVDEQERHSCFKIVKQGLQCRLIKLAICHHADEAGLGIRTLQVKLGRKHIAAG